MQIATAGKKASIVILRMEHSHRWTRLFLALMIFSLLGQPGCKKRREPDLRGFHRRLAVRRLTEISKEDDPNLQKNANTALSQLRRGVRDASPILFAAYLLAADSGGTRLCAPCFDADQDLRGFCISERHLDPNGEATLIEERYPVFAPFLTTTPYNDLNFPVEIRNEDQRKDEQAWNEYVLACLEFIVRQCADARDGQDKPMEASLEVTLPSMWVSIPEPNHVEVYISAYDRAGHESNQLRVQLNLRLQTFKEAVRTQGAH
jgi:hypothetical protein